MSRGKCSGCGLENASCAKIRTHINTCPDYVKLFHEAPEKCLDPEDEMVQFAAYRDSDEGQLEIAEAKEKKYLGYKETAEQRHVISRARWSGGEAPDVVGS